MEELLVPNRKTSFRFTETGYRSEKRGRGDVWLSLYSIRPRYGFLVCNLKGQVASIGTISDLNGTSRGRRKVMNQVKRITCRSVYARSCVINSCAGLFLLT